MTQQMIKKPYKITLWEDKNKIIYDESQNIQNEFLEEVCIATIGSDTMDTPIRAFNPILTEDLNGSKTFTFQIYYRYWDNYIQDFKLNPFLDLLVNERKIKLKYGDEWYDFVIKQCQESSDNKTFVYTCKDLFINELGKTGYEVELDTELMNNMGTIKELGDSILEGTDWHVDHEESDTLIQKNKEMLYAYTLNDSITASYFISGVSYDTINAGQVILIPYSSKINSESPTQFLYKPQNESSTVDEAIANYYQVDEYGFVKDCENLIATLPDGWQDNVIPSNMFGEKIIRKQETHYIPQIDEVCSVWTKDNERYYAYTELDYSSVAEIQSMLSNGCGFISTNAWIGENVQLDPKMIESTSQIPIQGSTLKMSAPVYNTGFFDNRAQLSPLGFVDGDKYVLMVRVEGTAPSFSGSHVDLKGNGGVSDLNNLIVFDGSIDSSVISNFDLKNKYSFLSGECTQTITYSSLINDYGDIRFYLNFSNSINLVDCKVFKYRLDSNNKLIIPDLQQDSDSIIQTRYNFFKESDIPESSYYTKQDLKITESFLENENKLNNYTPIYSENCEKITSISGSKSNRFNLIQSLCEAFECWAKFVIDHDENGKTLYSYVPLEGVNDYVEGGRYYQRIGGGSDPSSDDSIFKIYSGTSYRSGLYKKVFAKKIIFKEFIGKDNWAGFRYGVNLKSIQRNIVSDQIATKVIVEENTNEFAPNGSCTIQQSILNPTGENALYNFQYYINHKLIDEAALNDDLYGLNGGLGFFIKMRQYNDEATPWYDQLTEISSTLYTLESRQQIYDSLLKEAEILKTETAQIITNAGYPVSGEVTGTTVPDEIENLRVKYRTYDGTINYYQDLSNRNAPLLEAYQQKYEDALEILVGIRKKKDKLNDDFENKYYSFIQEGTWNSNDYYDPELYYQAANMVLYTSSFPQISYTISVLELSQLEGYSSYTFAIADKSYIEDTEFFGYDSKGRPYKEEIVVSQVKYNLDDPSQNTITVQNYKTQFQDLFQRIAATSQSLQYHEGEYNRAASSINNDGTINSKLMQNTLEANALIISNAKNQSVSWDDTGITITNFMRANEVVRLTSEGIVLTKDGGQTWTTGITGEGINADVITAGCIDTDRIRIFNEAMNQTFEWNASGINAYMWDTTIGSSGAVNYGKFVRLDQYGLYGYSGGDPSWDPNKPDAGSQVVGINKVIRDSVFSLTWKGLNINIPTSGTGSQTQPIITVGPSNAPVFQVAADGTLTATSGSFSGTLASGVSINSPVITGGTINIGSGNFVVDSNGNVTSKGKIVASKLQTKKNGTTVDIIKYVDDNTSDFDITSAVGNFSGSFSGDFDANSIDINNSNGTKIGTLYARNSSSSTDAIELNSLYGLQISAGSGNPTATTAGDLYLNAGSNTFIHLHRNGRINVSVPSGYSLMTHIIAPSETNTFDLGTSTYKWHDIYATNGSIQTSDKKEKKDINYDLTKYESLIKDLKPVSYKFNDGHRDHIGFIAQDIEDSLNKNQIDSEEFAGFVKSYSEEDKGYKYGLRYSEFIALQQWQIQKLEKRIEALENLTSSSNSDIL